MSELVPTGEELVPTGEELVPTGEELVPTGEELVPTGEELVPTGEELVPTGEELALGLKYEVPNTNMSVTLMQAMGSDQMVADAARVSTDRDREGRPIEGLIKYLAREKHFSPFDHTATTFMIEAPLFVRDQWVRHRTQSYSCLSLRYTGLTDPKHVDEYFGVIDADKTVKELFYFPPANRPLENEGSKAHPKFTTPATESFHWLAVERMEASCLQSYRTYLYLLRDGVAEEVARSVLPETTMTRFYATANLRNWAAFVQLRDESNAQWEIQQLAKLVSAELAKVFPISWAALMAPPPVLAMRSPNTTKTNN